MAMDCWDTPIGDMATTHAISSKKEAAKIESMVQRKSG